MRRERCYGVGDGRGSGGDGRGGLGVTRPVARGTRVRGGRRVCVLWVGGAEEERDTEKTAVSARMCVCVRAQVRVRVCERSAERQWPGVVGEPQRPVEKYINETLLNQ